MRKEKQGTYHGNNKITNEKTDNYASWQKTKDTKG